MEEEKNERRKGEARLGLVGCNDLSADCSHQCHTILHATRIPCIVPTTHKIAMGLVTDSSVPCPDTLMAIIMTPCMRGRSQGSKGRGY